MPPPADGELIERILQNDLQAFDQLFIRYKNSVYRFAFYLTQNRNEADDLFQETWLRVVKNLVSTTMIKNFKAWIFTIITNLHRNELRKRRIRRLFHSQKRVESDMMNDKNQQLEPVVVPNVGDTSESIEIDIALKAAIKTLPPKQRQIFILKEVEGFKYTEISKILKLPVGTIKSQLHRTIKHLQKELADFHNNQNF